jgi:hypothetical protein
VGKRQYVRFKRKHPNKGRLGRLGLRRASARRRESESAQGAGSGCWLPKMIDLARAFAYPRQQRGRLGGGPFHFSFEV